MEFLYKILFFNMNISNTIGIKYTRDDLIKNIK